MEGLFRNINVSILTKFYLKFQLTSCFFSEPAGYKCIWKINRAICEKLSIPHGSEVYGEVVNTDFEELTVDIKIESVKHDDIQLPEKIRTDLLSVYPTVYQENVVNADFTADILDRYRFFYTYIFFPFDNDGELNWSQKHLITRVQFFFDLNNSKTISKNMKSYIRQLIEEAKYIKDKRELLENSMESGNDSCENLDLSKENSKEVAVQLLELYLRTNRIKNEIELLANPEMREVYETLKFPSKDIDIRMSEKKVYVVNKEGTINDQIQLLEKLKSIVDTHDKIHWMQCLNIAIERAGSLSQIYIPAGINSLKFLEYMNESVLLCGVNPLQVDAVNLDKLENYAVICANDLSSMLFAIDGDIKFKNLVIDCRNVNIGFIVKGGFVSFENCFIFGPKSSSGAEAFNVSGKSFLCLENCVISNFGTAFDVTSSKLSLINSIVKDCGTGIVMSESSSSLSLEKSTIINMSEYAILKYIQHDDNNEKKILLEIDDKTELQK